MQPHHFCPPSTQEAALVILLMVVDDDNLVGAALGNEQRLDSQNGVIWGAMVYENCSHPHGFVLYLHPRDAECCTELLMASAPIRECTSRASNDRHALKKFARRPIP